MKLLKFRLYGSFAHFNQPASNLFKNTYSIIPKPHLLGILGAIVGLKGYINKDTVPEYYERLNDIKIYINPKNKTDRKFVVTYNSLNSFLYNRKDEPFPNMTIKEQVLMDPDYEIGLVLNEENELHKKIIENIKNNKSVFNVYFGKNEFPANIEYISLEGLTNNSQTSVNCQSIFPFELLSNGINKTNFKLEMIPSGFDENFKYIYCLMAVPETIAKICVTNPNDFIVSGDRAYYVF